MSVPRLKTCCQMCIIHHIIGNDYGNLTHRNAQAFLHLQLGEGAWGSESLDILDRAVEHLGYFLAPSVILALLPTRTETLCLKECPELDEVCLEIALKRCNYLKTIDITENPLLCLSKVEFFSTCRIQQYTTLTSAILEDCPQVEDAHIHTLLKNAPNLLHLNIARCGVTDKVFLIDEDKQLTKEACLDIDERFMEMRRAHMTYDCQLRHVDVSRCPDFSSSGIRHLCTLCGPTLRSINFAWTKVDCTAFLYLSGLGFPDAIKFFLSSGALTNSMMKPLLEQYHAFEKICSDIVSGFADGADAARHNIGNDHPTLSRATNDLAESGTSTSCLSESEINMDNNATSELSLENSFSDLTSDRGAPKFEMVCMDEMPTNTLLYSGRESQRMEESNCHLYRNSDPSNPIDKDCANSVKESDGKSLSNDKCNDSNEMQENKHKSNMNGNCEHFSISSNDKPTQSKGQNNLTSSSKELGHSKAEEHPTVHKKLSSSTLSEDKIKQRLSESYLTKEDLLRISKTSEKNIFFTPNITRISLNATVFQNDLLGLKCFQKFLTMNQNLLSLTIYSGICGNFVSDCVLHLVGLYARKLEYLSVQGSDKLTDNGFTEIARNCRNLTFLDLTGVSFVGDNAIIPLVNSLPLTHLNLAETRITAEFMNCLASLPLTQKLKEIDLSWCEEVNSDLALNKFISSCPRLEKLMLRECCVSANTITCIAKYSSHLTELSLASNMNVVDDDGVILITENLTMLTAIDLGWNWNLKDPSVRALLSNCPRLEKANLEGLKMISAKPFLPLISVPEDLNIYLQETMEGNLEISELPCLPHRSTRYGTNLKYVNLTYSDLVEDTIIQQIVTITNGGIQILDYYGNRVEPSKMSLELFFSEHSYWREGRGDRY